MDSLIAGEQNLRDAKAYFSTGYHGQQEIGETIKNIHLLASSLRTELEGKQKKK
jgi:hypothetical protein